MKRGQSKPHLIPQLDGTYRVAFEGQQTDSTYPMATVRDSWVPLLFRLEALAAYPAYKARRGDWAGD